MQKTGILMHDVVSIYIGIQRVNSEAVCEIDNKICEKIENKEVFNKSLKTSKKILTKKKCYDILT